jgi:hypothetical protein
MSDVSRRTLIKATGAFGASMLPTALPSAVAAEGHAVPPTLAAYFQQVRSSEKAVAQQKD